MLQPFLKLGCEWNIQTCPHLQQGSFSVKDISEGVAGQAAEVRAAGQTPHQRLFERFSGTGPQLLLADPSASDIFTCRPATVRKHNERTSVK